MTAVKDALDDVIADLRSKPVSAAELDAIKRSCIINRRETLNPQSPSAWRTLMMNLVKNDTTGTRDGKKYIQLSGKGAEQTYFLVTGDDTIEMTNAELTQNTTPLNYTLTKAKKP